jgi:DNA invertase Pin-like site-specific DNA recombinase
MGLLTVNMLTDNKHTESEGFMKTSICARVSTNEQSPEMQLTALREYCKARGFEIFKEYVDTGFSGSKDSRPALNELVADAKKRKFDAVLVFKLDRYFRSAKHLLIALEEFKCPRRLRSVPETPV